MNVCMRWQCVCKPVPCGELSKLNIYLSPRGTTADVMVVCCCVVDNLRLFSTSKVLSQDKGGRDQDGKEDNENEEQPEGELWSSSGHLPAERTSGKHASVSEWDYEYSSACHERTPSGPGKSVRT